MKNYRLLVFDWDGTVYDSLPRVWEAFRKTFELFQLPAPDENLLRRSAGKTWQETIATLLPDEDPAYRNDMRVIYNHVMREGGLERPTLLPGVDTFLRELKEQGYLLAVATNRSRAHIDQSIDRFDMNALFQAVRGADETAKKPDPTMLHSILEELEIPAEETLMVGDTDHDVLMALKAGVDSVAVKTGGCIEEDFTPHRPIAIFDNILGMRSLLA